MANDILNQAAALTKAGKKDETQKILEPFIKANLQNIPAWLLEAETWSISSQKKKVLEACLRYNPDAPQVQQALAALEATTSPIPPLKAPRQQPEPGTNPTPSALPGSKARPVNNRNKMIFRYTLLVAILLSVLGYLAIIISEIPCTDSCTRVLFIGNSYTFVNDLPGMFADLARSGGHRVQTGMLASGGWALSAHVNASETLDKLKSSQWDFVVLQEQSQIPSVAQYRTETMYPAARTLVHQIEQAGAMPIFFMTWAHRDGWPENGLPDYETMQLQIDGGYLEISQELKVPVAPVGYAWLMTRRQNPELDLWQNDGSHPGQQGTYLAACVFYAVIFRQSPAGLTYSANLPKETASILQMTAADIVLKDPKQWNLP